jgi:hypothetical protein
MSLTTGNQRTLRTPLGAWQVPVKDWREQWDCFVNESGEELYVWHKEEQLWKRHILQPQRRDRHFKRYHLEYITYDMITGLQNNLRRASIRQHGGYIEVIAIGENLHGQIPQPTEGSLWSNTDASKESILQKLEEILHPVYLEASDNIDQLLRDFGTGQTVAVSDGSYYQEINGAAAAWVIESNCQTQWIRGSMLTPGPMRDFSAYRSELTGLLAISITLKLFSLCTQAPQHSIIGCDGKAALQVLQTSREDLSINTSRADIRSIIVDTWSSMTTNPFPVHIRGHQDTRQEQPLTRLEVLNVMMDKLATIMASSIPNPGSSIEIPTLGIARVKLQEEIISGEVFTRLYNGLGAMRLQTYFENKLFNEGVTMDIIASRSFVIARSQAPLFLNTFLTKWLSNTLPTGVVMQKRRHRIFNRCPRCNAWGEDKLHILVCWDTRASVIWNKEMNTLQQMLIKEKTCPQISQFLMDGLRRFRAHPNTRQVAQLPWQHELIRIGWINVISGFLGTQLIDQQSRY